MGYDFFLQLTSSPSQKSEGLPLSVALPPYPPMEDYARSSEMPWVMMLLLLLLVMVGLWWILRRKARREDKHTEELTVTDYSKLIQGLSAEQIRQMNGYLKSLLSLCFGGSFESLTPQERSQWWSSYGGSIESHLKASLQDHLDLGESYLFRGTALNFQNYHHKTASLAQQIIEHYERSQWVRGAR